MKIQNLAIIFIIIILPISLVLSSYMQGRVTTLKNQLNYDTKLYNATYDAVKAFQINTLNSDTSNQANSKMRDLQAAVNSFFNSMQTNFSMNGYSKDILQTHVPALVFTLYDGYYIYSPFNNTLDQETKDKLKTGTAKEGYTYDLKPYVYYSCRYKGSGYDVVITYSLDSYITIQGIVDNTHWDEKGYLLSGVNKNGDNISYRGVQIDTETGLKENVIIDGQVQNLEYRKVNGVKYYLKGDKVYTVTNGKAELQTERNASFVRENTNAKDYYTQAYDLKDKILNSSLSSLKASDAVDENGNSITIQPGGQSSSVKNDTSFYEYNIFGELQNSDDKIQTEDKNSDFNAHKMQVIKRSVIRNLSMAISDFNGYSGTTDVFKMPRLSDEDWDKLTGNIGMISFLQGLNVGGKEYNGYSIITNNKNKEFVAEDSIYIEQETTYHKATDTDLTSRDGLVGYFNIDYERRTGELIQGNSQVTGYYNPRSALGCYQSIVRQENVATGELKDWLNQTGNINLKKAYYTALGRERCSMYRVQSFNATINSQNGSGTESLVTFTPMSNTTYAKSQSTRVTANGSVSGISYFKCYWGREATEPADNKFVKTFNSGDIITKADGTGNDWYLWVLIGKNDGTVTKERSDEFYLDNTAPTVNAPGIKEITANSITAGIMQTDSNSGIDTSSIQYAIKKSTDINWGAWVSDNNNTHTFSGLETNTEYEVKTRAKDKLGNGYSESSITTQKTKDVGNIDITLSNKNWTNQDITASITYPTETGLVNQYSYDGHSWQNYSGPLTIDSNRTIYAKTVYASNINDVVAIGTKQITNIDKTPPTVSATASPLNERDENNDLTIVNINAEDVSGINSIKAVSGIKGKYSGDTSYVMSKYNKAIFEITDNAGNIKNYKIKIREEKVYVNAEEISADKEKYYGKIAKNYENSNLKLRIFYVDTNNKFGDGKNTIYLKADSVMLNIPLNTNIDNLNNNDLGVYKRMNKKWANMRGKATSVWNANERAAAWLSAPSVWKRYSNGLSTKVKYVIASPSAEMYVASYNQVPHNGVGNNKLALKYSNSGYKYLINGKFYGDVLPNNSIDYIGYGSMYAGANGQKSSNDQRGCWWLSSPSADNSNHVCYVNGVKAYLSRYSWSSSYSISPVVALVNTARIDVRVLNVIEVEN